MSRPLPKTGEHHHAPIIALQPPALKLAVPELRVQSFPSAASVQYDTSFSSTNNCSWARLGLKTDCEGDEQMESQARAARRAQRELTRELSITTIDQTCHLILQLELPKVPRTPACNVLGELMPLHPCKYPKACL